MRSQPSWNGDLGLVRLRVATTINIVIVVVVINSMVDIFIGVIHGAMIAMIATIDIDINLQILIPILLGGHDCRGRHDKIMRVVAVFTSWSLERSSSGSCVAKLLDLAHRFKLGESRRVKRGRDVGEALFHGHGDLGQDG